MMKRRLYFVAIVAFISTFFGFKPDSEVASASYPRPAIGCRYTGFLLDTCYAVPGAEIWYCKDQLIAINCYYDPTKPIIIGIPGIP